MWGGTARAARKWNRQKNPSRVNWWSSAKCVAYYNAAICGEPGSTGCRSRLRREFPGRAFERAVSIGCGSASKEIGYLADGLVRDFDLWEISSVRIDQGRKDAQALGVGERAHFHMGDVFADRSARYDLVHWDHSLHHMSDVAAAVSWSTSVLRPGGVLLINDYVGPNRLQWVRAEVDAANAFLKRSLEARGIEAPKVAYSNLISRLKQIRSDPSEAPQSEKIAGACAAQLPGVVLEPVGGTLLNMLGPVVVPRVDEDSPTIDELVVADAEMRARGSAHFAFALWTKG